MYDLDSIRSDLLDVDKGYYVLRDFYSDEEVDAYRGDCNRFLERGKVIHCRINTNTMIDYVHPRSHDRESRTYRIYQYFHNHKDDLAGRFLNKAIDLRNRIEEIWLSDPVYRAESKLLQDYVIVTYYLPNTGMLPKHQDYNGPALLPLIQFSVLLSQPETDYKDGNLVLYSKSGRRYRVESDLGYEKGDALIFNKALFHEVEATAAAQPGGLGRWSVLIGARAKRDSWWQMYYKRWCFNRYAYPVLRGARDLLRNTGSRFRASGRPGSRSSRAGGP